MPIRDISILKSYFETGDRPTALQFCDLLDSFIHRTSGLAVSTKSFENNILNIAFSDGTSLEISIPTQDIIDSMLQSIDNLSTGLDTKVDKVDGKGLSSNDYTDEERDKLEGLENYVPPNSETIAFIEGLQEALNQKADDVGLVRSVNSVAPDENGNVELPISNEETGSGIEIRDENDVLQFSADEFIQFEGFSFDPTNRRILSRGITANTFYIDGVNGDDLTGKVGDILRPFKTFSQALALKPTGVFFTFNILNDLVFDAVPTSETFIYSAQSVILDFSLLVNSIGSNNNLNIYAPQAKLLHNNSTEGERVSFMYTNVNITVREIEIYSDSTTNHIFEAPTGSQSLVVAHTIKMLDGGGTRVRGTFFNINVRCFVFVLDRQYLVNANTNGTFDINRLETNNTNILFLIPSRWDSVFLRQPSELVIANLDWHGVYDASKSVIISGNVRIRGNELVGRENPLSDGTIEIFDANNLRIQGYYGRLASRLVGGYTIYPTNPNCNVQILDSKIICSDDFMRTNQNQDYSLAVFIVRNLEVEFTETGKELFHDINPAGITVKRTGFLESNGVLGSPVTITNNLDNSF